MAAAARDEAHVTRSRTSSGGEDSTGAGDDSVEDEVKKSALELCEGASDEAVLQFAQALEAGRRWGDMSDVMTDYLKRKPLALSGTHLCRVIVTLCVCPCLFTVNDWT